MKERKIIPKSGQVVPQQLLRASDALYLDQNIIYRYWLLSYEFILGWTYKRTNTQKFATKSKLRFHRLYFLLLSFDLL
jgi:hypothetical protein